MKKSFYKYFNCNTKEELYLKLKENSKDVLKLKEYLEFVKKKENNKIQIRRQDSLLEYLKNNIPDKNEVQVIMFNQNMNILSDNKFPVEIEFKDILNKSFSKNAVGVILISHEKEEKKLLRLELNFELFGYNIIDRIELDENLKSYGKYGIKEWQFEETDIINGKNKNIKEESMKYDPKEFDNFMDYYAKKELLELNIKNDKRKIKEILKMSNQEKNQEHFGVIEYDKNQKIIGIETVLFKGGITKVEIDPRIFTPFFLNKNTEGLLLFHNHPSGSVSPSKADLHLTDIIEKMANCFNKKIEDHYILGREEIFSFKDELLLNTSFQVTNTKEIPVIEKNIKINKQNKRNRLKTKGQER